MAKGNTMLIDYTSFKFRAVVDWIEIEIHTTEPTHYDAIYRLTGAFTDPIEPSNQGKSASVFRLKIQDPSSWQAVVGVVDLIKAKYMLAKPFAVVGIEVAFDAYNRNRADSTDNLAMLVANFHRFNTHTNENRLAKNLGRIDKTRMYRMKREVSHLPPLSLSSLVRELIDGWQIGIGNQNSDCYQHAYFKTTDGGKPCQHRARIEITLRGNKLPCTTHEEWSKCNFAVLAKPYFNFHKLRTDLTPLRELTADSSNRIGKRIIRNRRGGGTKLFDSLTKADTALNSLARDKLRGLSDRWKAQKTTRSTVVKNIDACGNTGDLKVANLMSTTNDSTSLFTTYNQLLTQLDSYKLLLDEPLLNLTPELEAEQERINILMNFEST